jgi:hypothetical protein
MPALAAMEKRAARYPCNVKRHNQSSGFGLVAALRRRDWAATVAKVELRSIRGAVMAERAAMAGQPV